MPRYIVDEKESSRKNSEIRAPHSNIVQVEDCLMSHGSKKNFVNYYKERIPLETKKKT